MAPDRDAPPARLGGEQVPVTQRPAQLRIGDVVGRQPELLDLEQHLPAVGDPRSAVTSRVMPKSVRLTSRQLARLGSPDVPMAVTLEYLEVDVKFELGW